MPIGRLANGMAVFPRFPTTQWTRFERERLTSAPLDWFCESYRPAILAYLSQHVAPQEAEDLCQEFFRRVVVAGTLIERADRDHGHLRGLVRVALSRFLIDHYRARMTTKRGGGVRHESLNAREDVGRAIEPAAPEADSPDRAFDRAWANHLLTRAVARTEEYYVKKGKRAVFDALRTRLQSFETGSIQRVASGGPELTSRHATVALHRMRIRVGLHLREEVAATVADPRLLADELEAIKQALEDR